MQDAEDYWATKLKALRERRGETEELKKIETDPHLHFFVARNSSPDLTLKQSSTAEGDLELWKTWKASPTPQNMANLLKAVNPLIQKEIHKWERSGVNVVNIKAEAIDILFRAFPNYNPSFGQINTFVVNQLQQLNRFVIQNQGSVRNAEHNVLANRKYNRVKSELESQLGRMPTDMEIKESMGSQGTIKSNIPIIEMNYSQTLNHNSEGGGSFTPINEAINNDSLATSMLFKSLNDQHKVVFQHTHGFQGAEKLTGKDIAKNLGISPARVSTIQKQIGIRLKNMSNTLDELNFD